jgi:plastocyanin
MKRLVAFTALCLTALLVGWAMVDTGTAAGPARGAPSGHQAKVRTIAGTVGPGFTISMTKARTHSGAYAITVHDRSAAHNFHLTGPGSVNMKTGVAFVGTRTWNVRLLAGTYRFQCDVHPTMMNGRLTVFSG